MILMKVILGSGKELKNGMKLLEIICYLIPLLTHLGKRKSVDTFVIYAPMAGLQEIGV